MRNAEEQNRSTSKPPTSDFRLPTSDFVSHFVFLLTLIAVLAFTATARGQCGPGGCKLPGAAPVVQPPMPAPVRPMVPVPPAGEIPEAVKQCYHSLVRIHCDPWGGSGTYLGQGMVLTCEHVVRDAQGAVRVRFPGGEVVEAAVLASDYAWDVALLELKGHAPRSARGIVIDQSPPQVGQTVYSAGYGKQGGLAISAGRVLRLDQYTIAYDPTNGVRRQRPTTEASGLVEPGDSGGAWLTAEGRLLGVVWGGREQDLSVSATTQLGGFLNEACNRWRRPFPKPDADLPPAAAPPPVPIPQPPKVDLSPIVSRLDAIDRRLTALENPPPKKGPSALGWLAVALGVVAGGVLFFRTSEM
jgi:hypothetical protein